jgi:hypothetical protein
MIEMCKVSETRNKLRCQYCRRRPPLSGRKGCRKCLKQNRLHARAKRDGFYHAGLCQHCGLEPRLPGLKGGADCLEVARVKKQNRTSQQQRLAA